MPIRRIRNFMAEFIKMESAGGILLFFMAIIALLIENSPWHHWYDHVLHVHFIVKLGPYGMDKSLLHWINDGLMAIFFFLVGLEIKREFLEGELSSREKAMLPAIAAVGGMVVPALVFCFFNWGHHVAMRGWAIPTATDIAFALGILALLGKRVPVSVKVFLTALAILDDLGAIIIIALFYTKQIHYVALGLAAVCLIALFILNRRGVVAFSPYGVIGLILWFCVLKSGIHATLGGVLLAMAIPLRDKENPEHSPLRELEHSVHPWVAFLIMPVFAFANAGVSFSGLHWGILLHEVPLGIALGLFIGKQIGVFGASWLFIKMGLAKLPSRSSLMHLYGVAILCGVGFTMSLFIGGLAYGKSPDYQVLLRVGVFAGSLVSGLFGYFILRMASKQKSNGGNIGSDVQFDS